MNGFRKARKNLRRKRREGGCLQRSRFYFGEGIILMTRKRPQERRWRRRWRKRPVSNGSVTAARRGQFSLFSPTQTRKKCRTDPDAPLSLNGLQPGSRMGIDNQAIPFIVRTT